jgi:hypothetical protein
VVPNRVEAALERCWQSGGPAYLFSLMLALGLGGLALLLSPLRFQQPDRNQHPVPSLLLWLVRVFALAMAGWSLVQLRLREAFPDLLIYVGVFGVVWVALRVGKRPEVAGGQSMRPWPVTRGNVPVWLGALLLTAAVGVMALQEALGHPCG